jgi:hypothetical protein
MWPNDIDPKFFGIARRRKCMVKKALAKDF